MNQKTLLPAQSKLAAKRSMFPIHEAIRSLSLRWIVIAMAL
jgi:hypothetical protein